MGFNINQAQGQNFGPAGSNHAPGVVPDPGAMAHSPPWLLGDDGAFHSPSISAVTPNPVYPSPTTSTYTLSAADYMRVISSASVSPAGPLTVVATPSLPAGFIFWVFRNNNNAAVVMQNGVIAYPTGNTPGTVTLSQNYQINGFVSDGTNLYGLTNYIPAPTYTRLTSGSSATYNLPAGCVRIKVRMCAGGGGGAARTTNAGSSGSNTSFGNWTVIGGSGGTLQSGGNGGTGGAGGTGGTNGTGTLIDRVTGGSGTDGGFNTATTDGLTGGIGGMNPFGGAGPGIGNSGTGAAAANTGGGGGGAPGTTGVGSSGGGGAGEYVEFVMTAAQVGASLTYTVGAGGNGGSAGGVAGGNGAAGKILIEEFYY